MKVTLYMAISLDGYIAKSDGDSDWIEEADIEMFDAQANAADCIIIWNSTFEQFKGDIYPIEWKANVVVTKDPSKKTPEEGVFYAFSPEQAVDYAKEMGHKNILLVGWWHINGSFLQKNLIDEVIVDVQPIVLGDGIKIFEQISKSILLDFIKTERLWNNLVLIHYAVNK